MLTNKIVHIFFTYYIRKWEGHNKFCLQNDILILSKQFLEFGDIQCLKVNGFLMASIRN